MSVFGRFDAERAKQRDVFGGVAQVILAANDVRDAHVEVVHDVDEVEDRLAVGTDDHEVWIEFLAISELAGDVANHKVRNNDRFLLHLEFDRAFLLVGEATREQSFDPALVVLAPLTLKVGAAIAFAWASSVAGHGPFVPNEAEPAQAIEDYFDSFLGIAGGVGVLDAKDE